MKNAAAVFLSPVGNIKLEASDTGLTRISVVSKKVLPVSSSDPILKQAVHELKEYFEGKRTAFNVPLDAEGTDFQKKAWKELSKVPYGKTVQYQQLAAKIGNPAAVRAVGTAMGKNPLCIIVPCHRVLPKKGGVGQYAYGSAMKRWLLQHETEQQR